MKTMVKPESATITGSNIKTNLFSLNFFMEITRENMVKASLLSEIFNTTSRIYDSPLRFYRKLNSMNGAVYSSNVIKKGGSLIISITIECLKNIPKSIANGFLEDIIYNTSLDEYEFTIEPFNRCKESVLEKIKSRYDDKRSLAMEGCLESMYNKASFGIPDFGYIDDLNNITPKSLYEFYDKYIINGNCIKRGILGRPNRAEPPTNKDDIRLDLGLGQGRLCIGYKIKNDNMYEALVLNEILGGSGVSKLFECIREKENLCYYVSTTFFRHNGAIIVESGIEKSDYKRAVSLITDIFETIGDRLTNEDLEVGKSSLINIYLKKADSPYGELDNYIDSYVEGMETSIKDRLIRLRGVSLDGVKACSKSIELYTKYFLA